MATVIQLKVRQCDRCNENAVALDGKGTDCVSCSGEYGVWSGDVKTLEVPEFVAEQYDEHYPNQIA